MGPIIEPAKGKLLNALTTLGAGENWAVEPKKLDETAGFGARACAMASSADPTST
jgi:hypothetical protein